MDVERLLTETLTDPRRWIEPEPADLVRIWDRIAATRRRRARRRLLPAVAVAVIGVATLALTVGPGAPPGPAGVPAPARTGPTSGMVTPTLAPTATGGTATGGTDASALPGPWRLTGVPVEVAAGAAGLWALQISPARVVRLDPASGRLLATAAAPSGDRQGLTLDESRSVLWAWAAKEGVSTVLVELDAATLQPRRTLTVPADSYDAVAIDGTLFLAAGASLLRVDPGAAAVPVVGIDGAGALAADRSRGRLYVVSNGGLVSWDIRARRVLARAPVSGVKIGLAVSGDGQLWLGRYASGIPLIAHLDPDTLREIGTSPLAAGLGPGAVVSSGQSVIWVRNNGEAPLTCIDARTGRVLAGWASVPGPVADRPVGGSVIAKRGPELVELPVSAGCPG